MVSRCCRAEVEQMIDLYYVCCKCARPDHGMFLVERRDDGLQIESETIVD